MTMVRELFEHYQVRVVGFDIALPEPDTSSGLPVFESLGGEVFGPILPVMTYKTTDEAIRLANDTVYGLSANVISADQESAEAIAHKINAGTISVNGGVAYLSPNHAFGGNKASGGRRDDFRSLVNTQSVATSTK